ncbi:MAG: GNAT family N-acetyltransferase [Chloroflexia bacterium]
MQRAFTEAVAVAELVPDHADATVGHLGIVVRDDWQGLALGTALIRELLHHAPAWPRDIRADLLAENDGARRLLAPLDFPRTTATRYGETQVLLRLPSAA